MVDLGFERHQFCIFHFKLSISKVIREHLRDLKIEQIQILKNTMKNPSQNVIDDEIEKIVKAEKREIRYALNIILFIQIKKLF